MNHWRILTIIIFFDSDPSRWASGCRIYNEVVYEDVYPGIDVRYYTSGNNIKYDFLVHPGADIEKIVLDFNGVDRLELDRDRLLIGTSVREQKKSLTSTQLIQQEKHL